MLKMNYQHIGAPPSPLYSFSFRCFWVFAQPGVGIPPTTPHPRPMKIGYIFMFYLPGSQCLVACLLEVFISRLCTVFAFFSGLLGIRWFAMTILWGIVTACLFYHYVVLFVGFWCNQLIFFWVIFKSIEADAFFTQTIFMSSCFFFSSNCSFFVGKVKGNTLIRKRTSCLL